MSAEAKEPFKPRRFSLFAKPLGKSLSQVIGPVCKKHGFAEHRLLTDWADIVGAEYAQYCIPKKLTLRTAKKDGGTLYLLVAAGRALEVQHLQPLIIDRINMFLGYPAVARLSLTQSHTPLFRKAAKPKPLKTVADGPLADMAQGAQDPEMRQALLSLAGALQAVEN